MKDCTLYHIGVRAFTVSFRSFMTPSTGLDMLYEYWTHCEYYPHCIVLNDELFDELSGILMHLILGMSLLCHERNELIIILKDAGPAGDITNPFDPDDLRQWLDMIDGMKSVYLQTLNHSDSDSHRTCTISGCPTLYCHRVLSVHSFNCYFRRV